MKINKEVIRGSLILLIAFGLFNFFNFLFHFFMTRMLSIENYGVLATMLAIIYIFGVFTNSIQTIVAKYSAEERDKKRIKNIFKKTINKAVLISSYLSLFYLIIIFPLSKLLSINYLLLSLNGLIIFGSLIMPISRGILQGKKRFFALGKSMVIEGFVKLILAVIFVFVGWKVYGAFLGIVFGLFVALFFSIISLKDIMKEKEKETNVKGIYDYTKPAFLIMLLITLLLSLDIIIAKIFFPADLAGSYSIASILAKTVFIVTEPIGRAMFPLSTENKKNKTKSKDVFLNSLIILFLLIVLMLILFYFFPELLVFIFAGRIISESVGILFYLAVAASFLSLSNLILLYKLSLGKVKNYAWLFLFVVIEVFLLSYFSSNLLQFSIALAVSSVAFLCGTVFFLRE